MTFAHYFKISSYALISSGFIAIAATGSIDTITLILFASVLIASWFLDTVQLGQNVPIWILNCTALAYFPFFVIDYRLLSHSFVTAAIHLLFFTAAVKLLTLSRDRDYYFLYLISFTGLLAASALTVDIVFGICFLVFLLSGVSTLVLFEMRRANSRTQNTVGVQPSTISQNSQNPAWELFSYFPARLLSAIVLGITLLILAIAIPLFFLLPRLSFGPYRHPSGHTRFISGFSDRVELGQIGTIKQSDAIVMRVKTSLSPLELSTDLKWRGLAFDHYDGRSWSRSDLRRHRVPTQGRYYKLENYTRGTKWLHQTFFIEALSTDVIFAAHKALAVSEDVGLLLRDSTESLYTATHPQNKIRYFAISDPIQPDPATISDLHPIPPEILETYLQLPPADSRIAHLANQVTRTASGRYAKARALEHYLRSNYSYSLELRGVPNSKDPLAMFLFDIRSGHCEYFASAMTIMLRHLRTPARLVNGFRAGEYNSIGDNWIVRQYNAHSWVEAYFPPYGWIEFDPTPPDPQRHQAAFTRILSNLADAIDLWWWEDVVSYDISRQLQVILRLRSAILNFQSSTKNLLTLIYEKSRAEVLWILSSSFGSLFGGWIYWIPPLMVVSFLFVRPWRRQITRLVQRLIHRGNPHAITISFYREALDILASHGMVRSRGQTPMEFARSLANHPANIPLLGLTRIYNQVRFGPPESSGKQTQAAILLRSLRETLRHS